MWERRVDGQVWEGRVEGVRCEGVVEGQVIKRYGQLCLLLHILFDLCRS